ncbi:MAG TPA: MBL fold metallo-hydrolase [Dehalococcoidales bacterium]|nr:MBL fold metallo-hydrolase [Dehalococcoidales bacterium]
MVVIVKDDDIQIERLELGSFGTNAYILVCPKTRESVLIDAPADAGTIVGRLKDTTPKYILLTHNHMDHIGALAELRSRLKVPLAAHALDTRRLPSPPKILLNNGDVVSFGNIMLEVLHTPGHTPGSLCFKSGKYLMSGDTIFPGGPGKTWSPADFQQIVQSITERIFVLPDDTQIYPGHGAATVLKKEKDEFAAFSTRSHNPNLCGDVLWLSS